MEELVLSKVVPSKSSMCKHDKWQYRYKATSDADFKCKSMTYFRRRSNIKTIYTTWGIGLRQNEVNILYREPLQKADPFLMYMYEHNQVALTQDLACHLGESPRRVYILSSLLCT